MILPIVIYAVVALLVGGFVWWEVDNDDPVDDIQMGLGVGLFWPVTLPAAAIICTTGLLTGLKKRKRARASNPEKQQRQPKPGTLWEEK